MQAVSRNRHLVTSDLPMLTSRSAFSTSGLRRVAQPGSAPRSGRGGRRFKSCYADQFVPRCRPVVGAPARDVRTVTAGGGGHAAGWGRHLPLEPDTGRRMDDGIIDAAIKASKTESYRKKEVRRSSKCLSLLGMPFSTANYRLHKSLMFSLVVRLELNRCFRCQKVIENENELSIEHKDEWKSSADPKLAFFDLKNIAFSHYDCNCAASGLAVKKYASKAERRRAKDVRSRPKKIAAKRLRRARLRAAGLPYS